MFVLWDSWAQWLSMWLSLCVQNLSIIYTKAIYIYTLNKVHPNCVELTVAHYFGLSERTLSQKLNDLDPALLEYPAKCLSFPKFEDDQKSSSFETITE